MSKELIERNDRIISDYVKGETITEIAKKNNITPANARAVIIRRCKQAGILYPLHDGRKTKGENTNNECILVTFYMRPEQYEALDCCSKYYGVPKDQMIRDALSDFYKRGNLLDRLWKEDEEKYKILAKKYPNLFLFEDIFGDIKKFIDIGPFTEGTDPRSYPEPLLDLLEEEQ